MLNYFSHFFKRDSYLTPVLLFCSCTIYVYEGEKYRVKYLSKCRENHMTMTLLCVVYMICKRDCTLILKLGESYKKAD